MQYRPSPFPSRLCGWIVLVLALAAAEVRSQSVPPMLSALSPGNVGVGSAATTITATGTGFDSTAVVLVNGNAVPTTFVNLNTLQFVVSAGLLNAVGPLQIVVRNPNNLVSNALLFYVVSLSPPVITSISPSVGLVGTSIPVSIAGKNLTAGTLQLSSSGVSATGSGFPDGKRLGGVYASTG